jgi:hypothetical protein
VGRMRVDSGAVQCHVLTRVRVGVCVGSHPRPAIHMRKKEASRCKVCASANGCMLVGVHGVQCEMSTRARTVVVRVQDKNRLGNGSGQGGGVGGMDVSYHVVVQRKWSGSEVAWAACVGAWASGCGG